MFMEKELLLIYHRNTTNMIQDLKKYSKELGGEFFNSTSIKYLYGTLPGISKFAKNFP